MATTDIRTRERRGMAVATPVAAAAALDLATCGAAAAAGVAVPTSHPAGFLAGALAAWWFFHRREKPRPLFPGAAILVALVVLALRGGVLRLAADLLGFPSALALAAAAAAGYAALFGGWRKFGAPREGETLPSAARWALGGLLLPALTYLPLLGLTFEEALHWCRARNLAPSYVDHPGGIAWLIRLTTEALGNGEGGVRAGAVACGAAAAWFLYRLAREMAGETAGAAAALLYFLCPFFYGTALLAYPDSLLQVFWAAGLYFGARAVRRGGASWILFGAAVGAGLCAKYTAGGLLVAMALCLLCTPDGRGRLRTAGPYAALGIAALVVSPVLLSEAAGKTGSLEFQLVRRVAHLYFSPHIYLADLAAAAGPVFLAAFLAALWASLRNWRSASAEGRWCSLASLAVLLPFGIVSFWTETKISWGAWGLVSLVPLAARELVLPQGALAAPSWRRAMLAQASAWIALLSVSFLLLGGGVRLPRPLPDLPWLHELVGPSLRAAVETALAELPAEERDRVVWIGTDKFGLASHLSYYVFPDRPDRVSSRNALGREGLTWNQWSDLASWKGRPAVLLAHDRDELFDRRWDPFFEGFSGEGSFELSAANLRHRLYYRIGLGYRPKISAEASERRP